MERTLHFDTGLDDLRCFVLLNGQLVECKVEKFTFALDSSTTFANGCGHISTARRLYLKTPEGKTVTLWHPDHWKGIYMSVEDARYGVVADIDPTICGEFAVAIGLGKPVVGTAPSSICVERWKWNGAMAEGKEFKVYIESSDRRELRLLLIGARNNLDTVFHAVYDRETGTLTIHDKDYYGKVYKTFKYKYATREDCESDNELKVVRFDDNMGE